MILQILIMLFKQTLLLTSIFLLSTVVGTPLENRDLTLSLPLQPESHNLKYTETGFEKWENCSALDTVVSAIGTSSKVVVYSTFGGTVTLYVCRHKNTRHCEEMAAIITSRFASLFLILKRLALFPLPNLSGPWQHFWKASSMRT